MRIFNKIFRQVGSYRDCPTHPGTETAWNYSDFFVQEVPEACPRCIFERRLEYVTKQRALGREGRLEEKRKSRKSKQDMCNALKSIYASKDY